MSAAGSAGSSSSRLSEAATIGLGGLILMLALAVPAFRETADDDWLKKSDLAVTFLDRYGNPIGSRGIKHNDSIPLEDFPDHLIKATLATEDRRFYDHFGIDVAGTFRALLTNAQAGGVRAGRLVDHPAARQEPVPVQRAHHRAQGQRGVPGDLAGDAADQERDPEALSRPRLYGRRHLRRRRRGAFLLQQVGARRESRRKPRCWPACSRRRPNSRRTSTCRPRAPAPTWCSTIWSMPAS